jgi:hypothetical protein
MKKSFSDSTFYWTTVAMAVLVTVGIWQVPYGDYMLWPFTILGTWVHEMGHGLMAELVGSNFMYLEINSRGGGTAHHSGSVGRLARAAIAAAGLLGPAFAGSVLILFGRDEEKARVVLSILAAIMGLSVLIYVRQDTFGIFAVTIWSLALFAVASKLPNRFCYFAVQFIGLQFCINNFKDFNYMFTEGFYRHGRWMVSDSGQIAKNLFLPFWFWGALVAITSIAMLGAALAIASLSSGRPSLRQPKNPGPDKIDDILKELG